MLITPDFKTRKEIHFVTQCSVRLFQSVRHPAVHFLCWTNLACARRKQKRKSERKGKRRKEKGKASIMHVKRKKEEDSHLMGCRSRGRGRQLKRSAERTAAAAAAPASSCLRDLLLSFFLRRLSLCLSFLYAHSSLSLLGRAASSSLCVSVSGSLLIHSIA